jgi:hypothetical protein
VRRERGERGKSHDGQTMGAELLMHAMQDPIDEAVYQTAFPQQPGTKVAPRLSEISFIGQATLPTRPRRTPRRTDAVASLRRTKPLFAWYFQLSSTAASSRPSGKAWTYYHQTLHYWLKPSRGPDSSVAELSAPTPNCYTGYGELRTKKALLPAHLQSSPSSCSQLPDA